MKILVVCQHYWPENFRINDIVQGFLERGCEVDVLCGQPNYPSGQFFEGYDSHTVKQEVKDGVTIYRTFEIKRGSNSNIRIFLNYITFPIAGFFRVRKLFKNDYDRVFIYQLSPVYMAAAGLRLARKKKIPAVMYILDIWPQNLYSVLPVKIKFLRKLLYRSSMRIYNKPDRLLTVSEKMRRYFIKACHRSETEVTFVAQAPEKLYEERRSNPALAARFPQGFHIVFTGNLSPAQNFDLITDAAAILKSEGFTDIIFIIVGDGMSAGDIKESVKEKQVDDLFFFEGMHPAEQMPEYADIADALIATLKSEGVEDFSIPAKVMSYMALGKPLLIAMDGEINDIIQSADCGFSSPPNEAAALAENIKRFYRMRKEERAQMGARAFAYQQEHFERNQSIDRILQVIIGEEA